MIAATNRGRVGGARTAEIAARDLCLEEVLEEAEIQEQRRSEAWVQANGEMEEWNAAVAANTTEMRATYNAEAEAVVSRAAAAQRSEAMAASTGHHTVSADLGDVSHGMTSAEKPVITLDGLPLLLFWVASCPIPTNISKRLVLGNGLDIAPTGPKSHVHTAVTRQQKMQALVDATKGGTEAWEEFPFQLPGTKPTGLSTNWYVRPASAAKRDALGMSTTAPTACTTDDAAFDLAVKVYTSSQTPLSMDYVRGAGAIFSLARWLDDAGWGVTEKWEVYEPPSSTSKSFGWALRAYGFTGAASGENFADLVGADGAGRTVYDGELAVTGDVDHDRDCHGIRARLRYRPDRSGVCCPQRPQIGSSRCVCRSAESTTGPLHCALRGNLFWCSTWRVGERGPRARHDSAHLACETCWLG